MSAILRGRASLIQRTPVSVTPDARDQVVLRGGVACLFVEDQSDLHKRSPVDSPQSIDDGPRPLKYSNTYFLS